MADSAGLAGHVPPAAMRDWLAGHVAEYIERLRALVRVPSVSADPARRAELRAGRDWWPASSLTPGCTAT